MRPLTSGTFCHSHSHNDFLLTSVCVCFGIPVPTSLSPYLNVNDLSDIFPPTLHHLLPPFPSHLSLCKFRSQGRHGRSFCPPGCYHRVPSAPTVHSSEQQVWRQQGMATTRIAFTTLVFGLFVVSVCTNALYQPHQHRASCASPRHPLGFLFSSPLLSSSSGFQSLHNRTTFPTKPNLFCIAQSLLRFVPCFFALVIW